MLEPPSSTDEQAQIAQLQALVLARETEIMARDAEIKERERYIRLLEEALRLMRAEKYGASREKLAEAPGQRGLFNEAEAAMEIFEAVDFHPSLDATPLREDKEPAKCPGRKALPAHLPRIEVRHELPALERVCGCGSAMTEMGGVRRRGCLVATDSRRMLRAPKKALLRSCSGAAEARAKEKHRRS